MNPLPRILAGAVASVLALAALPVHAGGEAGRLSLRDLGGKFVGYTTKPAANGSADVTNGMFVQYMLPAERKHPYPLVLIHGGGGQGTDWLQTPDGRDGWADYFVADGWDVYVVDRPGHGRSQSNAGCGEGKVRRERVALESRRIVSGQHRHIQMDRTRHPGQHVSVTGVVAVAAHDQHALGHRPRHLQRRKRCLARPRHERETGNAQLVDGVAVHLADLGNGMDHERHG